MTNWLGLVIGNSRLHWAWFDGNKLQNTWDTPHLKETINSLEALAKILPPQHQPENKINSLEIYLASVVPTQTALWQYPKPRLIALKDIPLLNTYPTLGIDRALAVYGAGETYHYPCLVIDGGTALTFTAVDHQQKLIGGAIISGLRSQIQGLHQHTAALPQILLPPELPPRWALDTHKAIASGIIYTIIGGIVSYVNDWLAQFPHSAVVLTGGDSQLIFNYLQHLYPRISSKILVNQNLIFWGLHSLKIKIK